MLLGKPDAPVRVYEFGDLQCPFCKANAEEATPEVIESQVRDREASITFNQFIIIGPESVPAGEAALAAGAQNRAWNFIEPNTASGSLLLQVDITKIIVRWNREWAVLGMT
jgi:protein-disulfide isomerase